MGWGAWRIASVLGLVWAMPASAGPPLLGDDPHTVGAGQMELITALVPVGFDGTVQWSAPVLDVTLGLFDQLDFALSGAPVFEEGEPARGGLSMGFKWQPIRGEHINAAFGPHLDLTFSDGDDPVNPRLGIAAQTAIVLPVQLEYQHGRWAVGTDLGYTVIVDQDDGWLAALYGSVRVLDPLVLVAEFGAAPTSSGQGTNLVLTGGIDWATPFGFNALVGGTGVIHTTSNEPRGWRAYVGMQWLFTVWGSP
jgi:hypothetical protein